MINKIYLLFIILCFGSNLLLAQHENDNWLFGNNKWKFDNSMPNGFTHTTNLNPYIRYISSVISDKYTGELLFYSDGHDVFNKNNQIMDGGYNLFGTNAFHINPADQSSIILPHPNSRTLFYIFYINGSRRSNDYDLIFSNISFNYGLRYAIVDISLNGGLGKVIFKNILFSNSPTNALTSTFGNDGNSYWIITGNNGNFLSYRLDSNGLNTTPVQSPGVYGNFIKISPNSKKLATRTSNVLLYDFNNSTGAVTNQLNVVPSNQTSHYTDSSDSPNSLEFSPDSNIIYFISSQGCLCFYPYPQTTWSGISMYNISLNTLIGGFNPTNSQYLHPLRDQGLTASLQLAPNNKIYLIHNIKIKPDNNNYAEVKFGSTINNNYYSYNWGVILSPNTWSPSINPVDILPTSPDTRNGFSFPQLIPTSNTCPDNLNINYQVSSSQNFQAGQSITASSVINDGLTVNYKAGNNVTLLPGFYVRATENGLFHAYIGPCDGIIGNFAKNSNTSANNFNKETRYNSIELKVFPNPASTFMRIDPGNEKLTSWELLDISGRSVLKGNSNQVNVQGLPKTTYLLNININNKITTKKVVVK